MNFTDLTHTRIKSEEVNDNFTPKPKVEGYVDVDIQISFKPMAVPSRSEQIIIDQYNIWLQARANELAYEMRKKFK